MTEKLLTGTIHVFNGQMLWPGSCEISNMFTWLLDRGIK